MSLTWCLQIMQLFCTAETWSPPEVIARTKTVPKARVGRHRGVAGEKGRDKRRGRWLQVGNSEIVLGWEDVECGPKGWREYEQTEKQLKECIEIRISPC